MKLVFVVQRYGTDVAGGAEALCRMFAERLAARGHDVSVLTSAARDYATWADHYPVGDDELNGVRVRRLGVVAPRDQQRFDALSQRVAGAPDGDAIVEAAWMLEQGPRLADFGAEVRAAAAAADVVVFVTYLYATTVLGLDELGGAAPALLHPAAHDEWPARLPSIRAVYDRADGIALSTPEELDYVQLRYRPTVPCAVVGIGFDPPPRAIPADGPEVAAFRDRFALGDAPYVLCLGRVDPNKGSGEAISFAQEFRRRHRSDLRLVLCGAEMMDIADRDGLVVTGFVDDDTKWAAIAGARAVVQPSRQESFGMTLAESWMAGRAVLVQSACEVTAGLTRRAGGGLCYGAYSSFDAALSLLLERPEVAERLAAAGRRHVLDTYSWDRVLDAYESMFDRVRAQWADAGAQSSRSDATFRPITA